MCHKEIQRPGVFYIEGAQSLTAEREVPLDTEKGNEEEITRMLPADVCACGLLLTHLC